MLERTNHQSGTPWEPKVGYARAVRVGNQVFVSGTTATDAQGKIVGKGDPGAQARQVFKNLAQALRAVGADLRHVVRTRMFVTDIARWEAVGLAHGEVFASIRPTATLVQVSGFVDSDMLVEIEVDAVVHDA
jgi:enamine deaminase RidA (YjgF/YER057c/UK114 family)